MNGTALTCLSKIDTWVVLVCHTLPPSNQPLNISCSTFFTYYRSSVPYWLAWNQQCFRSWSFLGFWNNLIDFTFWTSLISKSSKIQEHIIFWIFKLRVLILDFLFSVARSCYLQIQLKHDLFRGSPLGIVFLSLIQVPPFFTLSTPPGYFRKQHVLQTLIWFPSLNSKLFCVCIWFYIS